MVPKFNSGAHNLDETRFEYEARLSTQLNLQDIKLERARDKAVHGSEQMSILTSRKT